MRKLLRIAVAGAILLAGIVLAIAIFSRTSVGRAYIRDTIASVLATELGATVTIGDVSGGLIRDLVLHDVRVRVDGRTVARVARIEVIQRARSLLRGRVRVLRLTAVRPWARLVRDA